MNMKVIRSVKEMSKFSRQQLLSGRKIGFVPTMGALHQGHAGLIREARRKNDLVVVSIFVNPLQFGPNEDYKRYPRDLSRDSRLCRKEGVDVIFYPGAGDLYPQGHKTYIEIEELSGVLCGKFRPGHFRGVAAIVAKLFNIVNPDVAYFGQKDIQQAVIIKRMVFDLNIPVKIKIMPIVREKDGLAFSSRNRYMNPGERENAVVLYQALNKARDLINLGEDDPKIVIGQMRKFINKRGIAKIDYISVVDPERLKPVDKISIGSIIALAVWMGKTRLIDNVIVK